MLEIGSLVDGKYKILNKVGQGGMSVVYLAMNEKANKQWAVKEVRKDGVKDFEVVKQGLVAETDILKKLNHPNLPSIIDVIDNDDSFIIIMDYIQGNSLNKALDEFGALPQEQVIAWAKQLCDVLGYLHSRTPAIIYRDMKPANIMLKPDGNVTLIDFGTAREFKERNLADTTCLGTVGYAAPEQFGGMGQTDARTDIYCLGATLYHLVTGMNPCEPPYEIKPIREINPSLSSGFERIIQKCTQRDPEDRYQSAAELMYALEHYEEIDDIYKKKQKKKLGAFIGSIVMSMVFGGVALWGYNSAEGKKSENYERQLLESDTVEAYFSTILIDTTRTEAYIGSADHEGLIDFLLKDNILTSEENAYINQLRAGLDETSDDGSKKTRNVLKELAEANPNGYADVCFEVGEAYLYCYTVNVDKDKYAAAATWFQYAASKYPIAQVYCDMSECLQNIAKYKSGKQFTKLTEEYKKLWEKIKTLQEDANKYDDDLKYRVWNETANIISGRPEEFVGVSTKEEIISLLNSIRDNCEASIKAYNQTEMTELIEKIDMVIEKIKVVKN